MSAGGALRVVHPGPLTLVQDLGRPGRERWGVAGSGAFDRAAHALAQRLVGNPPGSAGLEVLLGGLRCLTETDVVVAVAGAPCLVSVGGRPEAPGVALRLPAGSSLVLGAPVRGLRCYLGVRGAIAVPPVLGSRSRDTGAALGPAPVAAGDLLPVGAPGGPLDPWYGPAPSPGPPLDGPVVVELAPGPHDEVAAPEGDWMVSERSDRVGVRLVDPRGRLAGAGSGSLPSFPVIPGSVQLTPAGELVVLGPDAGVTGGYPVLGVATAASLDRLAQCRPGDRVTIRRRTRRSPGRRARAPS